MLAITNQQHGVFTRNQLTVGIKDVGELPCAINIILGYVTTVLERCTHFPLFIERIHSTTREVQSQVKPFVSKGEIESEVQGWPRILAIADGALIHPVDYAITIKVFVFHVAGTQRTVTLAIVVDWPAFNLFPVLELSVRLQTPVQVAIP